MASIFLTKAEANAARCSICRSYLSVGPIWIRRDYRPVCGRCTVSSDEAKYEVVFYEKIAKYIIFPCRYDGYGCDIQLTWGSVQSHEQSCRFRPMKCAALLCDDDIRLEAMEEHFLKKHPELVMNKNEFQVPGNNFEGVNKLYIWQKKKFLVQIGFHLGACYCNIASFEQLNEELFYDLSIHNPEKMGEIRIRRVKINHYRNKNLDHNKMKKLDYGAVSKLLINDVMCNFNISRNGESQTDPVIEKFLPDLECPLCFHYMRPPIYMCETGHSVCNICKNNLSKCPSCSKSFSDSRNFTLEKIFEHVSYPCKFKESGCNFYGKGQELISHESSCSKFGVKSDNQTCYCNALNPCLWIGPIAHYGRHLKDSHSTEILRLGSPITLEWNKMMSTTLFACYNEDIFRVNLTYGNGVGFRIQVLRVSSVGKCEYKFYINFTKNDDAIFLLTRDCGETSLDISRSLVKPFLRRHKLTFTLRIIARQ